MTVRVLDLHISFQWMSTFSPQLKFKILWHQEIILLLKIYWQFSAFQEKIWISKRKVTLWNGRLVINICTFKHLALRAQVPLMMGRVSNDKPTLLPKRDLSFILLRFKQQRIYAHYFPFILQFRLSNLITWWQCIHP